MRAKREVEAVVLTREGVLINTNSHREQADLATLSINSQLNSAAENKLNDMFAKQYFEHVGPDGRGPDDWIDDVGYNFIIVGENLALGNFSGDQDLVQAWMDSPGHRANILQKSYREIGIAVGQGIFEGRNAWIAVQAFGSSSSLCSPPNEEARKSFDTDIADIDIKKEELDRMSQEFDSKSASYNELVAQIKSLVDQGNAKIQAGNQKITNGNQVMEETGDEAAAQELWDEGESLQDEGSSLFAQVSEKQDQAEGERDNLLALQDKLNEELALFNSLQDDLAEQADAINSEVSVFNNCLLQFKAN